MCDDSILITLIFKLATNEKVFNKVVVPLVSRLGAKFINEKIVPEAIKIKKDQFYNEKQYDNVISAIKKSGLRANVNRDMTRDAISKVGDSLIEYTRNKPNELSRKFSINFIDSHTPEFTVPEIMELLHKTDPQTFASVMLT